LKGPERSAQVNFGAKHSRGKYVYRVDSDFLAEPEVIEQAVLKCEEQGCDAVRIHNTSDPRVSFWARVRKFERDFYRYDNLNVGARFIKKEVFEAVKGFGETLIAAEDYDLHNRLLRNGFSVGQIKAQEIHLGEPKTLGEIVRKHYFYGRTIQNYIRRNPEKALQQFSPIRLGYSKYVTEFLRDPLLSTGLIIYQFVRYSATAIGLISSLSEHD
jgi:GT2 family glycosyltransferase